MNPACENYLGHTINRYFIASWKKQIITTAITLLIFFSYDDFSMEKIANNTLSGFIPYDKEIITIDKVKTELKVQDIMCSREVLAQIKIESAYLSSSLFKRTNNMLGMRYAFNRETNATGLYIPSLDTVIYGSKDELKKFRKKANYAVYNTWKDGIADYKIWQEAYFQLSERYLEFLGNNYAEDPFYVNKIRQVTSVEKHKK